MKFTNNKHNSKGTVSSRMLYVLLALWVSLGIQPCAVAAVSDADCPHCPPEETFAIAPENDHCGGGAEQAFDATASNECCDADDGAIDTRYSTVDLKDLHDVAAAPPSAVGTPWSRRTIENFPVVDPPDQRLSRVPLYILNCVYRY